MPKLGPVPREKLIKVLRANGITRERSATRHYLSMSHPLDPQRRTTIPNDREISVARLRDILRQVQKPRDEFLRVLSQIK